MQPFYDPSTTTVAASSSSISTSIGGSSRRNPYKVFLSFREEDTRNNFVSHLYKELGRKGIHTFKDDPQLKRGDSLTPSLLEAISGSRVAVVVLSEHYASSMWCLRELVEIMECRKRNGQLVIPIFHKVDPSDVKNQRGSFGKDLEKHGKKRKRENNYEAEMEKWRNALTQVATIAGWDSRDRNEANLIECVVRDISDKLTCATSSYACDDFVGIDSQIVEIDKLLEVERDVHMLGIWGMGGIGKTTLAYVLYKRMSAQYQGCCFLRNVKDDFKKIGATGLREKLLSKVLKERDLNIWSLDEDYSMIKERLCCKKVLIVLDDVDEMEQLEVLAKHHNWFGFGSMIIITTRDQRLLHLHEVDATYQVKLLKNDESFKLFSRHAFKQNQIEKDYWELAIDFVKYAKGIPLALKVLGSSLRNRPINFWEDELQILKSTPKLSISNVLKVSFDGLEDNEKNVFLDIACFHNWSEEDEVRHILSGCGLFSNKAFPILIEKSLISIQENKVDVHELLQDMGRDIVQHESSKLGERSRLWDFKDIKYVLTKKKGTKMIKGICLNLFEIQGKMNLEKDVFVGMEHLRFLKVYWEDDQRRLLPQDKLCLPHCGLQLYTDELAYLRWEGYPSKSLSLASFAHNLFELDLSNSKVETLWEEPLEFVNLKVLNLEGSKYLVRTPNLSKAQNIEKIDLSFCVSLIEIHPSIVFLDRLKQWSMLGCKSLSQLPNLWGNLKSLEGLNLGMTITEFPPFVEFLSKLKTLNFSWMPLSQLPNCFDKFKLLENLTLLGMDITELPQSIENLTLLTMLDISSCEKLESLPTNLHALSSLQVIYMKHCKRIRFIPKLPPFLIELEAAHCELLENFSDNSIKNGLRLEDYDVFDFNFVKCLKLGEEACNNIFSFALSIFQKYPHQEVKFCLPGSEIPTWICNQAVGSSINVKSPSNFATIRRFLCCVVLQCENPGPSKLFCLRYRCQFKGDSRNQSHEGNFFWDDDIGSSDHTMLWNFEKPKALDCAVGDELSLEFFVACLYEKGKMKVNKCGVCFLG